MLFIIQNNNLLLRPLIKANSNEASKKNLPYHFDRFSTEFHLFYFLKIELIKEFVSAIEYPLEYDLDEVDYSREREIFFSVALDINEDKNIHWQAKIFCYLLNNVFINYFLVSKVNGQKYSGLPPPRFSALSYL